MIPCVIAAGTVVGIGIIAVIHKRRRMARIRGAGKWRKIV